jgi:hypothetical protein
VNRSFFSRLVHVFFALLMLVSAGGKLLDMPGFYQVVQTYQMLPGLLIPAASWALTLFELALGFMLLFSSSAVVAAVLLVPLHLFYLAGLGQALFRGLALKNCGCFGVFWARPLTPYSLLEDVFLLCLTLYLLRSLTLARSHPDV